MNCQKCGKELEKGWINSAREVIYTRKLKKMFIEPYVCRDCHWVIVPYEEEDA